jgi:hypothetical protein
MIPEAISEIGDVGYLLVLLRVASKNRSDDTKEAVLTRLHNMGVLDGEGSDRDQQKMNLKALVDEILGRHGYDRV